MKKIPSYTPVAVAVAALLQAGTAYAQESLKLDEVVVTSSSTAKSKMRSSVSVTDVDSDTIKDFGARTEAEVLLLIPGIRTEATAGPGGNANISVRGLPISSGGSKYVQIQEDGLPTVQFGDMMFSNNDYWTRFDATTATVEAVRGGSSATLASQAPGAVINYISHTGDREGGFVQINRGLDYNDTRVDFRYGGNLAEGLNFHIGGFLQRGNDILDVDYGINEAIQIKGNLTKEFDDGASFLRLFFKVADTQGINYTGAPALADINGRQVTNIRPFPGFDGRSQSNYSINNQEQLILNREGTFERVGLNGISTDQQYFGAHLHWEFGDNITIDNRARYSDVSGQFSSPFLNVATRASVIGSTINGSTVAAIRYANGPRAGQLFTDPLLDNNVTSMVRLTQALLPVLPRGASVINQSSIWGRIGVAGFSAYSASKHAVVGLTRSLALELGPRGIRVNAVCPGWVRTDAAMRSLTAMAAESGRSEAEVEREILARQAVPTMLTPDQLAGVFLFLASDGAAPLTGQCLVASHGEVMA